MCSYVEIDEKTMWKHAENFRGDMFQKDINGKWMLKNPIWEIEPIEDNPNIQDIMRKLEI